ncbi:uncharacterized protein LOC144943356 [Lampetra fluviatilis]
MARCLENSRSDASPRAGRFWVGSPKPLSPVVEILEHGDLTADHSVATRAHGHTTGALKGAPVVKGGVRLARGGSLQSPPPLERAKEAPLEEDGFGRRVEETKATADLGHGTWDSRGDFKGRARGPVTQELSPPSWSARQAARNREGAEVYWSSPPRTPRGAARRRRKKSVGAGAPVDDPWTQWVCMQIEAAVEHELVEEGGHVPDPIFML